MRFVDYLFAAMDLSRESPDVREAVGRVRDQIDLALIYVEAADAEMDGRSHEPPAEALYDRLWVRGWLGRRWALRAELRALVWLPFADDRLQPLVPFASRLVRRLRPLLERLERARRAGAPADYAEARKELAAMQERLGRDMRELVLERTEPPSALRCPQCGGVHVDSDQYLGGIRMLGCKACGHAESAREDEPEELAALRRRWGV